MKTKTFYLLGYPIEIYNFGYASFMYPSFNEDAEFRVSKQGFKRLYHYIRTVKWLNEQMSK